MTSPHSMISINMPRTAKLLREHLNMMGRDTLLVSPFGTINIDIPGRDGWYITYPAYCPAQDLTLEVRIYSGEVTYCVCEVNNPADDTLHTGFALPRHTVEAAFIIDGVFLGHNPSAHPMDWTKVQWKFPSTYGIPDAGWAEYEANGMYDEFQAETMTAIWSCHAEAWDGLGLSQDQIDACLGDMTDDEIYPDAMPDTNEVF